MAGKDSRLALGHGTFIKSIKASGFYLNFVMQEDTKRKIPL